MTVPYNFKAIEKKWHDDVEGILKNDTLPVVKKRNEILDMHMKRMKKKIQFPKDLYWDYGYDAVGMYEIFSEPDTDDAMWDDGGIDGMYRFLTRCWRMSSAGLSEEKDTVVWRNQLIAEVEKRLAKERPGTVISAIMEYTKRLQNQELDKETLKIFLVLLCPFAPYMTTEIWHNMGFSGNIFEQEWPVYDSELLKKSMLEIPVQVNGKVCSVICVPAACEESTVLEKGRKAVEKRIQNGILKEIYIPGRILSFFVS